MESKLDLVSQLGEKERVWKEFCLKCISPDDSKYEYATKDLKDYLTAEAEWRFCAKLQRVLLETRMEFGKAEKRHLDEVDDALGKISPLNMALLEQKVTHHDQIAVIEEIGRHVPLETKAMLHPGTTSADILDTVRAYLHNKAWVEVIRPEGAKVIENICKMAEENMEALQAGRTHLQVTSPVPFGATLALYAARITRRLRLCDRYFRSLGGKISGIVGTGADIEMVIGEGRALEFEKAVLAKLGLKPDYTATQIVQKEELADVGHGLTTLALVLDDFANDIRILYSTEIGEVYSLSSSARLGGSSADAMKDNPIDYENICGTGPVVEGGMRTLYAMIQSNLQRDLRGSKGGRYQPRHMMAEVYEACCRMNKALLDLRVNKERMEENLMRVRKNPSEAMVAILKGERWIHPAYGNAHDFVKEIGKLAKREKRPLLEVALGDVDFRIAYEKLPLNKKEILQGKLERYTGCSLEKATINIRYARKIAWQKLI